MNKINKFNLLKGFTLVELMVTVGIFVLMTGVLLARYGKFNHGIILTNLAYDTALTVRNAQSYGLNVKSAPSTGTSISYSNEFNFPYGVQFKDETSSFILYADGNKNNKYDTGEAITTTNIKRGSKVSELCVGIEKNCSNDVTELNIIFKRPDPVAHIFSTSNTGTIKPENAYAEITLQSIDGSIKKVVVRATGQIGVK